MQDFDFVEQYNHRRYKACRNLTPADVYSSNSLAKHLTTDSDGTEGEIEGGDQGETAGKISRGAGISKQTYYKWQASTAARRLIRPSGHLTVLRSPASEFVEK